MSNLFTQIIEKYKEKEYDKPRYLIKKLYIGSIVKCKDRHHIGFGFWNNYYNRVKDFAVFYKINDKEYVHIKSGQKLRILDEAIVGDYCIKSVKYYSEIYVVQMREDGHTKNTRLSKKFLEELETAQNMELAQGPVPMHNLFGA